MNLQTWLHLAAMTLMLLPGPVGAQADERAAVLALMENAFAAVSSGNPDDWRAIQLAEGTSISFRADPKGLPGELMMRIRSNEAEAAAIGQDGGQHEYLERWTGDPTVLIRSPIAVVWGEYEFWVDGAFSHCGVDAVNIVRVGGDWKIANWMWTVEKDHCPTAPARQPQ